MPRVCKAHNIYGNVVGCVHIKTSRANFSSSLILKKKSELYVSEVQGVVKRCIVSLDSYVVPWERRIANPTKLFHSSLFVWSLVTH